MQARFATEDLSDRALDLSPASRRTLARDVGYAAAPPGRAAHAALSLDADTTLGALAGRATAALVLYFNA